MELPPPPPVETGQNLVPQEATTALCLNDSHDDHSDASLETSKHNGTSWVWIDREAPASPIAQEKGKGKTRTTTTTMFHLSQNGRHLTTHGVSDSDRWMGPMPTLPLSSLLRTVELVDCRYMTTLDTSGVCELMHLQRLVLKRCLLLDHLPED